MKERPEKRLEWIDKNKYNSFNSYKGLAYINRYMAISKWIKGEVELLPPIECSLDPTHLCNFRCSHCNAQRYLVLNKEEIPAKDRIMSKVHMHNLIDFLSEWGVKGVCIGGGGEPLMNRGVWTLPAYIAKRGMESSLVTNGYLIDEDLAEEVMHCRWIGVSVDAGDRETFKKVHGIDLFDKVINNLRFLVRKKKMTKSKVDIAYKMLIRPDNIDSIYSACKLARDIGVSDFHVRPVDLERKDFKLAIEINYNVPKILKIFNACHKLETDSFRVFTIVHKYDPNFRVMHKFSKCLSSPLMIQCCADGNVYVCADHRIEKRFLLDSHYPDPKNILNFWGSNKHRKLLKRIYPDKECGRCFIPGVKVTTPYGIKNIEILKKGDSIVSGKGKIRKVLRIYKNKYKGKIISIDIFGDNRTILTTPYHKFNSIKTAQCTVRNMKKCLGKSCGILINMKNYRHDIKKCKNPSKKYKVEEIKASNLNYNHLLILPKLRLKGNKLIKPDLAWILGMYIAEGHYDISGRHHRVSFYLSDKEKDIAKKISKIVKKYFKIKNQKPYVRNGSMTLSFESKKFVEIVKAFGNSASEKTIPFAFIVNAYSKTIKSLLRGYFEGDGAVLDTEKDKTILATTVSESLANQIRLALASIEIMSCIYKLKKRISQIKGRKIYYRNNPFLIRVSPSSSAEKLFPNRFRKGRKHPEYIYETKFFFAVPIKKIKTTNYNGYVYNLEVEKDHSYLVNGVVVKNCTYGEYARQIEEVVMTDGMCLNFP